MISETLLNKIIEIIYHYKEDTICNTTVALFIISEVYSQRSRIAKFKFIFLHSRKISCSPVMPGAATIISFRFVFASQIVRKIRQIVSIYRRKFHITQIVICCYVYIQVMAIKSLENLPFRVVNSGSGRPAAILSTNRWLLCPSVSRYTRDHAT